MNSMYRLLDSYDRANTEPKNDLRFAFDIYNLFNDIRENKDIGEDTQIHLEEMGDEYLLPDLVANLQEWYSEDQCFESAINAISLLQEGITKAKNDDWYRVATVYYLQRIHLKAGLSGHDAGDVVSDSLTFLEAQETHSSFIQSIIRIVTKNINEISSGEFKQWKDLLKDISEEHHNSDEFERERQYLWLLVELKTQNGEKARDEHSDLVDSYRLQADLVGKRSNLHKASVLESGVRECADFLDEDKKREWKREALQARRVAFKKEMVQLDVDQELEKKENEEISNNSESIVNFFKEVQEDYDSTYALYCLVSSTSLVPDHIQVRLSTEEYIVHQVFQKLVTSPEGYAVSVDPDHSEIPDQYHRPALNLDSALGNALYQLIDRGHLTEANIFKLFYLGDSLSTNTQAFLTDSVIDSFESNYLQSLYVSIPHLEAAIVDNFEKVGRPPSTIIEEGSQQQLLGGLLREAEDLFGEDLAIYLRFKYVCKAGLNMRNEIAHGQFKYQNVSYLNSLLVLFDILRIMVRVNSSPYVERFGFAWPTLSPSTHYGEELDLSLFVDVNKTIRGYGLSDHAFVVIREEHNSDITEIFVDWGKIDSYLIEDSNMSTDELESKIDEIKEDNPRFPDISSYTWFDDDLLIATGKEIINELSESTSDRITTDRIFDEAEKRGINEIVTRNVLDYLDNDDFITFSEDSVVFLE